MVEDLHVSDKVSAARNTAVEALLPIAFAGFRNGMLSISKGPITMDITDTRVRFSGPESSVDMEVMKGFGGKPVTILNLPNAAYQGLHAVQVGLTHAHRCGPQLHAQRNQRLYVDDGCGERREVGTRLRTGSVRSGSQIAYLKSSIFNLKSEISRSARVRPCQGRNAVGMTIEPSACW